MFELLVFFVIVLALLGAGAWFLRGYLLGPAAGGRDRRIGVSEVVNVDGRRKLMLIHRDGVEHLIMTGGPVDMVIEQGILPQRRPVYEQQLPPQPLQRVPQPVAAEPEGGFRGLRQRGGQPSLDPQ